MNRSRSWAQTAAVSLIAAWALAGAAHEGAVRFKACVTAKSFHTSIVLLPAVVGRS